jgi:hypothetical protein
LSEEQLEPTAYQQYDTSFKSLLEDQTIGILSFFLEGIEHAKELSDNTPVVV